MRIGDRKVFRNHLFGIIFLYLRSLKLFHLLTIINLSDSEKILFFFWWFDSIRTLFLNTWKRNSQIIISNFESLAAESSAMKSRINKGFSNSWRKFYSSEILIAVWSSLHSGLDRIIIISQPFTIHLQFDIRTPVTF